MKIPSPGLAIGLMTGTSADGIDAALVEIAEGDRPGWPTVHPVHFLCEPFSADERSALQALNDPSAKLLEIMKWHEWLGERLGLAARHLMAAAGVRPQDVTVIGSHGQTVAHYPDGLPNSTYPGTVQIASPARLAETAGVAVVSDFRSRDIALGGQGAPLVPYFDYATFATESETRAVLNLGGIGNVTLLPAGGRLTDVIAFDTGPANMVLDAAVSQLSHGSRAYDEDGAFAAAGQVIDELLRQWLEHPYFFRRPPKTTGREDFGVQYTQERLCEARAKGVRDEDLLATLAALVGRSVAQAISSVAQGRVALIASGGGTHNRAVMNEISAHLPLIRPWQLSDEFGIAADAKEAIAFAYFAWQFLQGRPTNVPSATGAAAPGILGSWTPKPVSSDKMPSEPEPAAKAPAGEDAAALSVRRATQDEFIAIAQLLHEHDLWAAESVDQLMAFLDRMDQENHEIWVGVRAEAGDDGNEAVAGVLVSCDRTFGNCGYVRVLAARKGETGLGVGAKLLYTAEAEFRRLERMAVFLLCTEWNAKARAFYVRQGYTEVGSLPDWLELNRSEVLYMKRLEKRP